MARSNSFSVDIDGLREWGAAVDQLKSGQLRHAVLDALRGAGGEAIVKSMHERIRSRTGTTKRYTKVHGTTGYQEDVEVGYKGPLSFGNKGGGRFNVGAWLESGTKAHIIRPRQRGGSLFFSGSHVTEVQHPGQRGRKIAKTAIEMNEWRVLQSVTEEIDTMLGRAR
jgi:hypothetical protein